MIRPCERDIGYNIDGIQKDLRYGGNEQQDIMHQILGWYNALW